jgi:Zn-dependent protease
VDIEPTVGYGAAAPLPAPGAGEVNAERRQGSSAVGRALAPLAAAAAAMGKYGVILLKLGKLGPTLISMILTVGLMGLRFGWAYGVGIVALIAVHETGHLLFARYEGIRTGMPIFLGPFGAVIGLKQPLKDARQEAVIAIGGPVVGTLGAILALIWSQGAADGSYAHGLLLSLAYFGFFVNLFNLIPFSPLDGGRVAGALSPWANVVGVVIVVGLLGQRLASGRAMNPILLVILVLGGISLWQRLRHPERWTRYQDIPGSTRAWIGVAYAVMLAVTAIGMSETHSALAAAYSIQ